MLRFVSVVSIIFLFSCSGMKSLFENNKDKIIYRDKVIEIEKPIYIDKQIIINKTDTFTMLLPYKYDSIIYKDKIKLKDRIVRDTIDSENTKWLFKNYPQFFKSGMDDNEIKCLIDEFFYNKSEINQSKSKSLYTYTFYGFIFTWIIIILYVLYRIRKTIRTYYTRYTGVR